MLKRELRHIQGAAILSFYYLKWPIVLGLPIMYLYLDYKRNIILDFLWIVCLVLIFKDFFEMYKRFKRGDRVWR